MTSKVFFIDNTNSTNNGSQINVSLNPPLYLDMNKKYTLSMIEMNFTYCFSNIITGVNDGFNFTYNGTVYINAIPQGLYAFSDLQNTINYITNVRCGQSNLFTFSYSSITGTTSVVLSANTQLQCGSTQSVSLFGFVYSRSLIYNSSIPAYASDKAVQFNTVKSVNVFCDLITSSYQNNNQSNLLGVITINSKPYNLQTFDPVNLMSVPITLQDIIKNFTIYLTDDKNNALDFTNGGLINTQYWNIKLRIDEL